MPYSLNPRFKLSWSGDNVFLVDVKEARYGVDEPVLMLNREGGELLQRLQTKSLDEIISESCVGCANAEMVKANMLSAVRSLCELGVLQAPAIMESCDTLPVTPVAFGPLKAEYAKLRAPLIGVVELTSKCNLNCPHCYVKGLDPSYAISTEKILEVGTVLRDHGILNVTLTGGEPLSHPDFPKIYRHFKELGFLVDVFSNATLIDEAIADLFAERPPRSVDVTIYGLSDDEYREFTGDPTGFSKLKRGLDLMKDRGVFFTTKMICNRLNYSRVDDYCKFACEYGAPFRYNLVIGEGTNSMKSPDELMLTNEQVMALERRDPLRRAMFRHLGLECCNLPSDCENCREWSQYLCAAGIDKVFVGYDGKMSPCMTLRGRGLDLFEFGYDRIWEYWGEKRKVKLPADFKCVDCEYLPICTPCTEEFRQMNGTPEKVIEQRCELAKMRWNEFVSPFATSSGEGPAL